MLTHLSALIGIVVGVGSIGWLGPLIILLVLRDRSAFVADHARTTLNFQITMLIANVVAAVLWLVAIGVLLTVAIAVLVVVLSIIAAVAASRGERYEYPLSIRFLR
ncbi:DUF4870 domain-containing protein [Amnibacterium setariae]|uniref:DUF4870 domain-containing protein n=2 Tax=Amnibacterium setariae TaxID=2306585 RepID=A0A3A1TZ90_9MICO|nr:DUF4870 domain-containing protein [Amnibacterium setariae]